MLDFILAALHKERECLDAKFIADYRCLLHDLAYGRREAFKLCPGCHDDCLWQAEVFYAFPFPLRAWSGAERDCAFDDKQTQHLSQEVRISSSQLIDSAQLGRRDLRCGLCTSKHRFQC